MIGVRSGYDLSGQMNWLIIGIVGSKVQYLHQRAYASTLKRELWSDTVDSILADPLSSMHLGRFSHTHCRVKRIPLAGSLGFFSISSNIPVRSPYRRRGETEQPNITVYPHLSPALLEQRLQTNRNNYSLPARSAVDRI